MELFKKVKRAPKDQARQSIFTIGEIMVLLAPWIFRKIMARMSFNARMAYNSHPEFEERGVKKPNAIGDALGSRGYGFYRDARSRGCVSSYENAVLLLEGYADHQQLADLVGLTHAGELHLAVLRLGFTEFDDATQLEAATQAGFDSIDELVDAMDRVAESLND